MKLRLKCLNAYRVVASKILSISVSAARLGGLFDVSAIRNNQHLRFNTHLYHTHIKIFGASVSHSPELSVVYSDSLSLNCEAVCTISQGKAYVLGVDEGIFAVLEGLFGLENIIYE